MAHFNQVVDAYIVVLGDDREQIRAFIRTCTGREPDTPSEWKYPASDGSPGGAFDEAVWMYDPSRCVHLIEASAYTETGEVREVPSQLLLPGGGEFDKDLVGAILLCDYDANILGGQRYANPSPLDSPFKWDSLALIFPDRVPRLPDAGSDVAYLVRMGAMPFGHVDPHDETAKEYALSIVAYHLQLAYGDVHVDDQAVLRILEAQVLGRMVSLAALLEDSEFESARQDIVREVGALDMARQEEARMQWGIIRRTKAGHRTAMQEVAGLYQQLNQERATARGDLERQAASLRERHEKVLEKQKEEDLTAAREGLERLNKELEDLEREHERIKEGHEQAKWDNRAKRQELERLEKELAALEDQHTQDRKNYEDMSATRHSETLKKFNEEREQYERNMVALQDEYDQSQKEYERVRALLQGKYSQELKQREEVAGQKLKLEEEIAILQERYSQGLKERKEAGRQKSKLEEKMATLQKSYDQELRGRQEVASQKLKLEEEITNLQQRYDQGLKEWEQVARQKLKLEEKMATLLKSYDQELKGREAATRQKLIMEEEIANLRRRYDQDLKDREWITGQKLNKERELTNLQKRYDQEVQGREGVTRQKLNLEREMTNLQKRYDQELEHREGITEQKSTLEMELANLQERYGQDLKEWEEIAARKRAVQAFSQAEATTSEPFQQPNKRRTKIENAYQEYERTHNWGEVKAQHPDAYEMQTFATVEALKESLPESVVKRRMGQIYLKHRQRDEHVEATTFSDTGNLLGPLISTVKLSQLGYSLGDIDTTRVYKFKGATGAIGFTLGSIALEGKAKLQTDEGTSSKTYHVWDDPIDLADILLDMDESQDPRLGDGIPPLLSTLPMDEYTVAQNKTISSLPAQQKQVNTESNDREPESAETGQPSTPNAGTENVATQSQPQPSKPRSRLSCCLVM